MVADFVQIRGCLRWRFICMHVEGYNYWVTVKYTITIFSKLIKNKNIYIFFIQLRFCLDFIGLNFLIKSGVYH